MTFPAGPQTQRGNLFADIYLNGGTENPQQIPQAGGPGHIWIQVGHLTGDPIGLFQKQDYGKTTNWVKVGEDILTAQSLVVDDKERVFSENEASGITKTKNVIVQGNFAYVTMFQGLGGFAIYNISDISNPKYITTASSLSSINNTLIKNNRAYTIMNATGGPGGIEVWDISDKENPIRLGFDGSTGQLFDGDINGNFIYAAGSAGDGLVTYDISNDLNPQKLSSIGPSIGSVRVKDNFLFVTDFNNAKLQSYDISTPSTPVFNSEISVGAFPVALRVVGDIAYVEEFNGTTVHIVDISNPSSMNILSNVEALSGVLLNQGTVAEVDNILYVMTNSTLHFFDVANKSNPIRLGRLDLPSTTTQSIQSTKNFKDSHIIIADRSPDRLLTIKNPFLYNFNVEISNLEISNKFIINNNNENVPALSSSPGKKGTVVWDSNFIYLCVDTDTWKRVSLSSF